jgi:hypothetical protein
MKNQLDRLVILLAATELAEQDIYRCLREAEHIGAEALTSRVAAFRRKVLPRLSSLLATEGSTDDERTRSLQNRVLEQIIRLLQREARLSPQESADRLRKSLLEARGEHREFPNFRTKDGFRKWLIQVLGTVPPSELLHHATKVRNTTLHERPTDWPLRDPEK